jgi:NAD(P)H dehydrogenase (quinone)
VRLLVRDAGRAPRLAGAEVVEADYGDHESLARALRGGDRVFMVSIHAGPQERVPLHRSFVETAARAEVDGSSTCRS